MSEFAVCFVFDFALPALQRGVLDLGDAYGIVEDMFKRLGPRGANSSMDAECNPSRTKRNKTRARYRKRAQGESRDDSRRVAM